MWCSYGKRGAAGRGEGGAFALWVPLFPFPRCGPFFPLRCGSSSRGSRKQMRSEMLGSVFGPANRTARGAAAGSERRRRTEGRRGTHAHTRRRKQHIKKKTPQNHDANGWLWLCFFLLSFGCAATALGPFVLTTSNSPGLGVRGPIQPSFSTHS